MMLPRHNYRSPEVSQEEARLTHEMQNASPEIQDVSNRLRDPKTDLQALQEVIDIHRNTNEPPPLISSVAEELNRQRDPEIKKSLKALSLRASAEKREELKSTIDQSDAKINPESSVNTNTAPVEKDPKAPTTFVDKTKDVVQTIGKSLGDAGEQMTNAVLPTSITKEMSRNKKIAIAGVATVGIGLVLWSLFRRARRAASEGTDAAQQTEGGFFRKWLVRIGVTAGVLFGLKMLADRYLPPKAVENAAKGAAAIGGAAVEGGQKAASKIKENFDESFSYKNRTDFQTDAEYHAYLASIVEDHGDVVMDRKNFASDEEYTKAMEGMLDVYQQNGGNWAFIGNSIMFIGKNGVETVRQIGSLPKPLWELITQRTLDKLGDATAVYAEGITLYASSFAIIDVALLSLVMGPKRAALQATKNAVCFPVTIARKGYTVAAVIVGGRERTIKVIQSRVAMQNIKSTMKRFRFREINPFQKWTPEHVDELLEEFKIWNNFDVDLKNFPDAKNVTGNHKYILFEKLKKGINDLIQKQGIVPEFLKNPNGEELVKQIQAGKVIDSELYQRVIRESSYASEFKNVTTGLTAADEIVETGTDASKATKAATPEAASQTHHTGQNPASIIDDMDNLKSVEKVADSLSDADLDIFLKTNNIPDALRAEVLADPKAKKILQGALMTGDAAEEARVIQMIQRGSKIRTAVVGGGMALSTFGLYMAYAEFMENREKMMDTKNSELQKIYSESNIIVGLDAGVQLTGIVVDGVALYQAATGTVLCSAAAPAGVLLLPITVAVMVGREGWRQSAHLREYFAKTDKDLAAMPPSKILEHIEGSKPMESINAMQSAIGMLSINDAKDQEKANLNSRVNGYRAYFAQSASSLIPHPTTADVRAARDMGSTDITDRDVEILYEDWMSQYVLEAEGNIRQLTNGQFYLVDTQYLNQVRSEAFARWSNKKWGEKNKNNYKGKDIESIWEQDIVAQAANPDYFVTALPLYILQKTGVADALAFAERSLVANNLIPAKEKQIARANLLYDMREEMQKFSANIDTDKSTSNRSIQRLVTDLVTMTQSHYLKTEKKDPLTTIMKELVDQPTVLCAQALEQFIAKHPLRPIYNQPQPVPTPTQTPYSSSNVTNEA